MNTAQLAFQLEQKIREHLLESMKAAFKNGAPYASVPEYSVPVFDLYRMFGESNPNGAVTSGFFYRIISDLKRTGIITVGRYGAALSTRAWQVYVSAVRVAKSKL